MSGFRVAVTLWISKGLEAEYRAYEEKAMAILARHGGIVEQVTHQADDERTEVHLLAFPNRAAFDSFLADPDRLQMAGERDRVIERTEIMLEAELKRK